MGLGTFLRIQSQWRIFYRKRRLGLSKGSRAIRTRTVDLLGKTDQTYYYQNDLNCFKDPTCIFCALGSFIN
ncbi:hypothetical protein Hanom_Chr15g01375281 [Helianthus anomalus]